MPPVRRSGRLHEDEPLSPEQAGPAETTSVERKPYSLRVFKGSKLGEPFEELYERNYKPEFRKRPDPTKILMPKDPRPPRLRLKDLTCVRLLGEGADQILLVNVDRRKKHPFDFPCALALKAKRRQQRREHALLFLPANEGDDGPVPPDQVTMFRQHFSDLNAEKICLVNMPWSPWVTGLLQTFHDSERLYMGLEYIPGGTLRSLLRDAASRDPAGGLKVADARFYYANIVMALEFLELCQIAHCDLKPENILLGADGYLVLTDFGISASAYNRDASWKGMGTTCYMAPEASVLGPGDPGLRPLSVDWWSSGIILYEMVTGKLPFYGTSNEETEFLVIQGEWSWPADRRIGPHLKALVEGLLVADPRQRLGRRSARQVQSQEWFSPVNWDIMSRRRYMAPFVPKTGKAADRWATLPLPRQAHCPGLQIITPPLHLAYDNRFPHRPPDWDE